MGRKFYIMPSETREKIRKAHFARMKDSGEEKCIFSYRTVRRIVNRSAKYGDVRLEVLKEKGSICELCGATEGIEVHHKKPLQVLIQEFFAYKGYGVSRKDIAENDPFYNKHNLYVYCKSCHMKQVVSHRKARSVGPGYKCFEALRKLREKDFK